MTNIQIFGKPIEKLIETVSKSIGTRYKPTAIRNEADAEAYKIEKLAQANARASIIKDDLKNEIAERAKERLLIQEINRQNNIEEIVDKSVKYLNNEVSEKPVDNDWRNRFFSKAQDVSSSEMQEIWAKILANEINNPEGFSLRTLDVVSNLSKSDAELFLKIHKLKCHALGILKHGSGSAELEKFGISYGEILLLRDAGLIQNDDNLFIELLTNDGIASFEYGEKIYSVNNHSSKAKYRFPFLSFTFAGAQLAEIIESNPNYDYLNALIEHWSTKGFEFTEAK